MSEPDGFSYDEAKARIIELETELAAVRVELESVRDDYAGMCQVVRDRDAELKRMALALRTAVQNCFCGTSSSELKQQLAEARGAAGHDEGRQVKPHRSGGGHWVEPFDLPLPAPDQSNEEKP